MQAVHGHHYSLPAGMKEALDGKLVISLCGGVTNEDLEKAVYGDYKPTDNTRARFVKVMPNTAAKINESMTVIAEPPRHLDDYLSTVLDFLFECIGKVVNLPSDKMDAATALAGSGPAFCLTVLEGLIDGAVAMGISKYDATKMAAQVMKGAALGVMGGTYPSGDDDDRDYYSGTDPAVLREQIATPGGCTVGGLKVLEEGVKGSIARCLKETAVVASQLGCGVKNGNGA